MAAPHNQHLDSNATNSIPTQSTTAPSAPNTPADIIQDALIYLHTCDPSPINAALTYSQVAAVFAAHDNFADVVSALHNDLGAQFTAKQFGRATFVKRALENNEVPQSPARYSYPWDE
ncbi:hypothetical protein NpNSSI1_00012690 [Neofusicoccum parvum]|nr:hypothetical protein NpNSSI1_00012690 [Neofusicoccum parvum]